MRLNEICQLDIEDVGMHEGILCFRVRDNSGTDKVLKNEYARRTIPVHPELKRIGLEEFVRQRSAGASKLFPGLHLSAGGHRSERFSRWFNEGFLPKVITKTEQLTFHSFRHGFRDALANVGTPIEAVDALGGWHTYKGASSTYGGVRPVSIIRPYLEAVRFEGLELSHLYLG